MIQFNDVKNWAEAARILRQVREHFNDNKPEVAMTLVMALVLMENNYKPPRDQKHIDSFVELVGQTIRQLFEESIKTSDIDDEQPIQ